MLKFVEIKEVLIPEVVEIRLLLKALAIKLIFVSMPKEVEKRFRFTPTPVETNCDV